ncbi:hypothetical protein PP742_gp73 [Alcaligenes phage vB_Af_QDWS595]|uniref:Uncharacterized protein n=1 Tax=Alcaligenes phage vB_Af_QDWS595 TaxID=2877946 RepID=A0AAE8Y1N9_9CAUD|nr:hypothetical protein PP742_gp73 [Alcaligenes phage vB_Af_QDWS595]UCR75557.1 hypothetical protein vBAfaPQDWS595_73 [Alcaligenes phage vB_Af_QDWS595]
MSNKTLLSFLKHWIEWVEAGAPHKMPYSRRIGLCAAYTKYSGNPTDLSLCILLVEEFQDSTYPFNGYIDYKWRRELGTQHECPKRLAWVRKTIKELENQGDS